MPKPKSSGWGRRGRRVSFSPAQIRIIKNRARALCYKCGDFCPDGQSDHVIPVAEGGATDLDNGAWICIECHKVKSREEAQRGYARRQARTHLPPEPRPFDHFKPKD